MCRRTSIASSIMHSLSFACTRQTNRSNRSARPSILVAPSLNALEQVPRCALIRAQFAILDSLVVRRYPRLCLYLAYLCFYTFPSNRSEQVPRCALIRVQPAALCRLVDRIYSHLSRYCPESFGFSAPTQPSIVLLGFFFCTSLSKTYKSTIRFAAVHAGLSRCIRIVERRYWYGLASLAAVSRAQVMCARTSRYSTALLFHPQDVFHQHCNDDCSLHNDSCTG
jgi:hypothetical protein